MIRYCCSVEGCSDDADWLFMRVLKCAKNLSANDNRGDPMRQTAIAVAFFCSIAFCPPSLWADCVNGEDIFTDADKKFMTDTVAVLHAAMPALEGWRVDDIVRRPVRPGAPASEWTPPTSRCASRDPIVIGDMVTYVWDARIKETEQQRKEIAKKISLVQISPLPADQQARVDEIAQKIKALQLQGRDTTDRAEKLRLNKETSALYIQANQIKVDAHKPQIDALRKEADDLLLRDAGLTHVGLKIYANMGSGYLRDMTPTKALAGAASAFTGLEYSGGAKTTLLFYGTWKKDSTSSALGAVFPPGANFRKVYNILVTAEGDPKQAELILSKLDGAALKALLGK
jgi:hypothetical protein